MAKSSHYTVRVSFQNGMGEFHKGEVYAADDPIVAKYPELFEPLVVSDSRSRGPLVEQATAAPGEQRGKAMTTAGYHGRA